MFVPPPEAFPQKSRLTAVCEPRINLLCLLQLDQHGFIPPPLLERDMSSRLFLHYVQLAASRPWE